MSGFEAVDVESDVDDDSDHFSGLGVRHEDTDDDEDDDDDTDDSDESTDDDLEESPSAVPADVPASILKGDGSQSPSGDRDDTSTRSGRRRSSNNSRQSHTWERVVQVNEDVQVQSYSAQSEFEDSRRHSSPQSIPQESPKALISDPPPQPSIIADRASRRMSLPAVMPDAPSSEQMGSSGTDFSGINITIPAHPEMTIFSPTEREKPQPVHKTDEDHELDTWNQQVRSHTDEIAALRQALAVGVECTAKQQKEDESVETLRLIVHHLLVQGKTDLVNTIRREAQSKGMLLMINPEVKLAGRDRLGHDGTELCQHVQDALYYLPPMDPTWGSYEPWANRNYRKDVIILKGTASRKDAHTNMIPFPLLVDHLFLDKDNINDYPYKVPITETFTQAFFVMYPEFVSPDQLLSHIGRFYLDIPDALMYGDRDVIIRTRVLRVLGYWIKYMVVDFTDRLLLKARAFCHIAMRRMGRTADPEVVQAADFLLSVIEAAFAQGTPRVAHFDIVPLADHEQAEPNLLGVSPGVVLSSIGSLSDLEVARQLCLLCHDDFAKIRVREFFQGAWTQGSDLWSLSCNLRFTIDRVSAKLHDWVPSQITAPESQKERAHYERHFVRIAYHCMEMNNLAAAQAIYAGIDHRTLNATKEPIGKRLSSIPSGDCGVSEQEMFAKLGQVGDPWYSKPHNDILEGAMHGTEPCIPILAKFQHHFVKCHETGESSAVVKGPGKEINLLVNWKKMTGMAKKAITIMCLQSRPYNFKVVPQIRKILEDMPGRTSVDVEKEAALKPEESRRASVRALHPSVLPVVEMTEAPVPKKKSFKKIRSLVSKLRRSDA